MTTKRKADMSVEGGVNLLLAKLCQMQVEIEQLKREVRAANKPKQMVAFKTRRYGDRIFRVPAETFRQCAAHTWVRYETEE